MTTSVTNNTTNTTNTTTNNTTNSSSSNASSATNSGLDQLAGNFNSFLTLLTTQLQNQDPLSPLDTNQFTQQLVEFASVEQQLKTNDQLTTLVSLQQTAQSTQALTFVGKTAVVDGSTAALTNASATWNLGVPTNSNVTISIANSTGQTVFTGNYAVNAGSNQAFTWDGKGNDGTRWPDGKYKLTATAADTAGNAVAVSNITGSHDRAPNTLSVDSQSASARRLQMPGRSSWQAFSRRFVLKPWA